MPPPRIKIRGIRQVVPRGYLLGRMSSGSGDAELLDLQQLRGFGLASRAEVLEATTRAGFGFNAGGLLLAGELLGTAIWAHDTEFTTGGDGIICTSKFPAAATATFSIKVVSSGGAETQVGTIVFATGSKVGSVTLSTTVDAGAQLKLYAPAVADATLADVSGVVTGRVSS